MPSPFAGTWTSTDTDGSSQTMGIQHADGDEHEVVLHDDAATACSGAPATVTGTARLSSVTELVVPQPVATCDDGSTPMTPDGQRLDEVLTEITFLHDPDTGTLTDSYGVVWRRPGAAPNGPTEEGGPIIEGPSPYEGAWVATPVDDLPESMEIHLVSDGDVHEVVAHDPASAGCSGGAATVSGTGRRETDRFGLVTLVISAAMTCDDGSEPIPTTPEAEGHLQDFPLSWTHDRETDQLLSSMGVRWWREPVYDPPTLPEPGDQPADPVAAEEQVRAAFMGLFDFSIPREERTQFSERPEVWAAANVELMDGQFADAVHDMYAQVDAVVFTDPAHATVQFQTITSDPIVPRYNTGEAVLVDGRWVVTITTTCGMVERAAVQCDMTL